MPPTPKEIRAARTAYGLTATDLATLLNVNERTVRRWENGDAPPPADLTPRLHNIEHHVEHLTNTIAHNPTAQPTAPPGLLKVAAWRAHLHHGTRIT